MRGPLRVKNVKFKVAGKYAYKGDFIITQDILYFFPHTDLIQKRINTVTDAIGRGVGGIGGEMIKNLAQSDFAPNDKDLMAFKNTDLALQQKLDAYIKEMKETRSSVTLSCYLPLPLRYEKKDIKNLRVTFMGLLIFDAYYDTHEYRFGILSKKALHNALLEVGFL